MYQIIKSKIGCLEIIPPIFSDHRGISIKPYHKDTFKELGLVHTFDEDLVVTSAKGVLRGLHLQNPPFEQVKLVWCVQGSILDVAVDVRKESPTYGQYACFHLEAKKHNGAYIPAGFAHGYYVLEEDTVVVYKLSSVYSPEHECGIRWDSLNIPWPSTQPILSDKDANLPLFREFVSKF